LHVPKTLLLKGAPKRWAAHRWVTVLKPLFRDNVLQIATTVILEKYASIEYTRGLTATRGT